jgi:phosphoribosylglycinamide formyltransferase 1
VRIAVLASHEGTTLRAVVDACASRAIPCQVVAIIGNNEGSRALERARAAGIPAYHLSTRTHPDSAALDAFAERERYAAGVEVTR